MLGDEGVEGAGAGVEGKELTTDDKRILQRNRHVNDPGTNESEKLGKVKTKKEASNRNVTYSVLPGSMINVCHFVALTSNASEHG